MEPKNIFFKGREATEDFYPIPCLGKLPPYSPGARIDPKPTECSKRTGETDMSVSVQHLPHIHNKSYVTPKSPHLPPTVYFERLPISLGRLWEWDVVWRFDKDLHCFKGSELERAVNTRAPQWWNAASESENTKQNGYN